MEMASELITRRSLVQIQFPQPTLDREAGYQKWPVSFISRILILPRREYYNARGMHKNLSQVISGFEEKAKRVNGNQDLILRIKKSQRSEDKQFFNKLDGIVDNMPDSEKEKLKKRFSNIIPDRAKTYIKEYDEQFFDALVEVLGYDFLQKQYPSCQVCIGEPDLIIFDNSSKLVAAMACKAIRHSKEHDDYVEHHQGEPRPVDHTLTSTDPCENPLLRKVNGTLAKAKEQLAKSSAPAKLIFVDFSWDPSAQLQEEQVKSLVQKLGEELRFRSIKLIAIENLESDNPFVCTEL